MSGFEIEIAKAMEHPHIRNYFGNELYNKMVVLIANTHMNCGMKFGPEQENLANLTVDELCNDLKKYNGGLSFREIELAFSKGWKNEYGDFFGLNNKTYFQWINAYTYSQNRLRVNKLLIEQKNKQNEVEAKLPQSKIDEMMKESVLITFEDFKRGANIFDSGNVKYNYLERIGILNFSVDRKKEILANAELKLKSEAIEGKQNSESIKSVLDKIIPETIKSRAKKDCLNIFFKELVETQIELTDIIENL